MRGLRAQVRRIDDGYECLVTIGEFTIGAAADDPKAALNAATGLASDLLAVIQENPALAALLPPQATAALAALRLAAAAARAGRLSEAPRAAAQAIRSILKNIL